MNNSGSTPGEHATAYGPYTPTGKPANITTGKLGYEHLITPTPTALRLQQL